MTLDSWWSLNLKNPKRGRKTVELWENPSLRLYQEFLSLKTLNIHLEIQDTWNTTYINHP
jgi:hypothetical protein